MVEEHVQMNETLVQMGAPHSLTVETLGHSEEVETMSMEVDVQVSFSKFFIKFLFKFLFLKTNFQTSEVGQVEEEINSMQNIESFMDHTDLGLDMMTTKEEVVAAAAAPPQPMIPVTLSLPVPIKTVLQPKKIVTTTSQVNLFKYFLENFNFKSFLKRLRRLFLRLPVTRTHLGSRSYSPCLHRDQATLD